MKRILSVILIVVILLSYCAVRPSAYTSVEIAYGLSLLKGTGSGLDAAYLALSPTRTNAAMIVLRLLGLESKALACTLTNTFTDANSATTYWHPILKYLYANPSVGFSGYTDGSFKPNDSINGQMLTKVLLTVLGYKQDVDFTWSGTFAFASSIGMKALYGKTRITNSDVAAALVEALSIRTKGGMTLVTELVTDGVINLDLVEKYGLVIENTEVVIKSAKITGVKTITVEFLTPIPKNTSVVLRRDLTGITHTYELSSNRTTLVITTSATLNAGTYTVVVGGKVQTVVVETEKAQALVINGIRIYKASGQDIGLKLLNQYGESMSISNVTISATNRTLGTRKITVTQNELGVFLDASAANLGDQIYIYALDNKTLLSDSTMLTVQAVPAIKRITVTDVIEASGNDRIYENTSSHIIKVEAYDQYGQEYLIKQTDIDSNTLMIMSTNGLCVSSSSVRVNSEGDLLFTAGIAGHVILRMIVLSEGISASADIQVYQSPYLSSMKVEQLPSTIFKNERIEVNVIGYDQYGNIYEIKSTDIVNYTTSNPTVIPVSNISIRNSVMSFYTMNSGVVVINSNINGSISQLFTATVNDGNVPYIITGIEMPFAYFEQGIKGYAIDLSYIKVIDQYGNQNSLSTRPEWDQVKWGVYIDKVTGSSFTLENNIISTTDDPGTDIFNIYITRDGRIMDRSGYSFSLTNVPTSLIQIFDINTPKTIYGGEANRIDAHTKYISIKGYTASNDLVMLKTDERGFPTIITAVTFNTDKIYVDTSTWAIKFNTYYTESQVVTVKYWKDGQEVKSEDMVVLASASKVSVIEYNQYQSFTITASVFYTEPLNIYDQYGIENNLPENTKWISNSDLVDSITFDPTTKRIKIVVKGTAVSDTEVIISYITSDGSFAFRGVYTIMAGTY